MKKIYWLILAAVAVVVVSWFINKDNESTITGKRNKKVEQPKGEKDSLSLEDYLMSLPDSSIYAKYLELNDTNFKIRINAKPFDDGAIALFKAEFEHAYMHAGNFGISNSENITTTQEFIQAIDLPLIKSSSSLGAGFYPVVKNNKFTFVLVKCQKNPNDVVPVPKSGNSQPTYYLIENGLSTITESEFNNLRTAYGNVMVRSSGGGIAKSVNNLNHPGVCFYTGKELDSFFNHNSISISSPLANDKIKFANIGQGHSNVDDTDPSEIFYLHSTLMTFFKNGVRQVDNNLYPGLRYKMKAMDYGKLCPPMCD